MQAYVPLVGVVSLWLPALLPPFWLSSLLGGPPISPLGITSQARPSSESSMSARLSPLFWTSAYMAAQIDSDLDIFLS